MGDGRTRYIKEDFQQLGFYLLGSIRAITEGDYVLPHGDKLHQAFERAVNEVPELRNRFHFSNLRAGRRCLELDDILSVGCHGLLLEQTREGYRFTVSHWNGLDIVSEMGPNYSDAEPIQELATKIVENLTVKR